MNDPIAKQILPYGVMIVNVLKFCLGHAYRSEVELMLRTMITESCQLRSGDKVAFIRKQLGGGPARSIFQIEPSTALWLLDGFLPRRKRQQLLPKTIQLAYLADVNYASQGNPLPLDEIKSQIEQFLVKGDELACFLARAVYMQFPERIPADSARLAGYYKRYFNTRAGKGSIGKCNRDWEAFHGADVVKYLEPLFS